MTDTSAHPTTVYVVDDDPDVRQSLRWLIESVGLRVETFSNGREFLATYDTLRPGCLVLDVRLPGMSGLELFRQLSRNDRALPVIIITAHADVPMAVRAMKTGAVDFLEKPFADQVLLERIQQAIDRNLADRKSQESRQEVLKRMDSLTGRERDVMVLMVQGLPTRDIAEKLEIAQKTVEVHRGRVMNKMQAGGMADLVRMALLAGIS